VGHAQHKEDSAAGEHEVSMIINALGCKRKGHQGHPGKSSTRRGPMVSRGLAGSKMDVSRRCHPAGEGDCAIAAAPSATHQLRAREGYGA
jgi:hypothetical protein